LKLGIYCGHKSGRFWYGNVRRIFLENPTLILSEAISSKVLTFETDYGVGGGISAVAEEKIRVGIPLNH